MKKLVFIFFLSGIALCYYLIMSEDEVLRTEKPVVSKKIIQKKNKIVDISRIIASEKKAPKAYIRKEALRINPISIQSKSSIKSEKTNSEEVDFDSLVFTSDLDFVMLDSYYVIPNTELAQDYDVVERRSTYSIVKSDFPIGCLLYTSPSPRDKRQSRMPSSA